MGFGVCHGKVNIVKQVKVDGKWTLRSIPKRKSGHYDSAALPDGHYFVEWREEGRRRRQPAGNTVAQAMEEQRRKRHELGAAGRSNRSRLDLSKRNASERPETPDGACHLHKFRVAVAASNWRNYSASA